MTIIRTVAARWAIWHVTAQCNIECQYCYGSFEGSSYKASWRPGRELDTAAALEVPWGLKQAGFDHVHINGGEPLLRPDIQTIVSTCWDAGLSTWLLTNGTVRRELVQTLAESGKLELLAVSLDTTDPTLGDSVRGLTSRALAGLRAALKGREKSGTPIGVYVVLTAKNLNSIHKLFDFLEEINVDYVNVQPVYLPKGHSESRNLGIKEEDRHLVADVFRDLGTRKFDHTTDNVRSMALETFNASPKPVDYCFANSGEYAYISPIGVALGCPSKPLGAEIGQAFQDRDSLARLLLDRRKRQAGCSWQSGDCLGMYEMASRSRVNK